MADANSKHPPASMADSPSPPDTPGAETSGIVKVEQAVEAILFAAGYPVSYDKLSQVIGLPAYEIRSLVAHMSEGYGDRGVQLLLFPDTCQLCTREEFAPYVREALGIKRGSNLSASSMEVLAVVAYNQPVTRAFVDTIRGVDSSYAISSLLDKGLIEATGRLEAPGRPMLYGTTEKFLRVFGLSSLSDLPETEALSTVAEDVHGEVANQEKPDTAAGQTGSTLVPEANTPDPSAGTEGGDAPDSI